MRMNIKSVSGLLTFLILVSVCYVSEVDAAPYQELPPRPGHIPVYIREGNQPLSEIHPGLAEAFHEVEVDQRAVDANSETINTLKNQVNETKDEKENNALQPPESDIASFDDVKKANDKAKDEGQKIDQSKNENKKTRRRNGVNIKEKHDHNF